MHEIAFQVEAAAEGGYMARVLRDANFTEAESLAELHDNVRDAVLCHFDEGSGPQSIEFNRLTA